MAREKACKNCKLVYEGSTCPGCGRKDVTEGFKGKVEIVDSEKSEIGKQLKINKNGVYAIRV